MDLWDLLMFGCAGGYLAAVGWLLVGLDRRPPDRTGHRPRLSVVVAARDEQGSIDDCLAALRQQDYRGELEVVVVDDHSRDQTAARVRQQASSWPQLRLVAAPETGEFRCPKKSALAAGIAASSGELLLFTDADCQPSPGWARAMSACFAPGVGLVAGYAALRSGRRLRQRLLALDNLAMGALGAGSFGWGTPLSCTGRNLAYRRQVYEEVGGFAAIGHLVGGDDVYFARLVAARTGWRLVFNPDPEAIVASGPAPERWGAILQQKLRHAAKAGHYQGPALGLAAAVYLFHLSLLVGLVQMVVQGQWNLGLLGVWGCRWAVDGVLLWRFAPRSQDRYLLAFLPLLELCYIPYVLVFSVLGRLGWFRWKR